MLHNLTLAMYTSSSIIGCGISPLHITAFGSAQCNNTLLGQSIKREWINTLQIHMIKLSSLIIESNVLT